VFFYADPYCAVPLCSPAASLSVACTKTASWSEGSGTQSLYTCAMKNNGAGAASSVRLSCSNLKAVTLWNIDADCSVPAPVVAGQTWNFGFVSTGTQPKVSVKSFTSGGAVSVVSKAAISLQCRDHRTRLDFGSEDPVAVRVPRPQHGSERLEISCAAVLQLPTQLTVEHQCRLLAAGSHHPTWRELVVWVPGGGSAGSEGSIIQKGLSSPGLSGPE